MSLPDVAPRIANTRSGIDISKGRGLEIGPLAAPVVRKAEAEVYYLDVLDTEGLLAHYGPDPNVVNDAIVPVDYALIYGDTVRTMAEAAAPKAPYDWAVASHVIEHVPDVITFLQDVAKLLVDEGRLALAVPDRRYCFDAARPGTTVGEILLAQRNKDVRPSVRAVYDHFANAVNFNPVSLWQGIPPRDDERMFTPIDVAGILHRFDTTSDYIDAHVWLFTPQSFARQLHELAELGLIDFVIADLIPTAENDIEFFATLVKLPTGLTPEERSSRLAAGFSVPDQKQDHSEAPVVLSLPDEPVSTTPAEEHHADADADTHAGLWFVISHRERRAIEAKRKVFTRLRTLLGGGR